MVDASRTSSRPAQAPQTDVRGTRRAARLAGVFFLAAFVLYGGGRAFLGGGDVAGRPLSAGAGLALVLVNSVAVAAIGFLFRPVLSRVDTRVATAYASTRILEALLLASGAAFLALGHGSTWQGRAVQLDEVAYAGAMAVLGVGSVLMCATLARGGLAPRPLAVFGMVGYAFLVAGSIADVAGGDVGLFLSVPGGLFELVFGIWLIARGFPTAAPSPRLAPAASAVR